jgi:hypothetical protein
MIMTTEKSNDDIKRISLFNSDDDGMQAIKGTPYNRCNLTEELPTDPRLQSNEQDYVTRSLMHKTQLLHHTW